VLYLDAGSIGRLVKHRVGQRAKGMTASTDRLCDPLLLALLRVAYSHDTTSTQARTHIIKTLALPTLRFCGSTLHESELLRKLRNVVQHKAHGAMIKEPNLDVVAHEEIKQYLSKLPSLCRSTFIDYPGDDRQPFRVVFRYRIREIIPADKSGNIPEGLTEFGAASVTQNLDTILVGCGEDMTVKQHTTEPAFWGLVGVARRVCDVLELLDLDAGRGRTQAIKQVLIAVHEGENAREYRRIVLWELNLLVEALLSHVTLQLGAVWSMSGRDELTEKREVVAFWKKTD
jgi:hypothetical protein